MAILNSEERAFLTSAVRVSYANPFLPERIDYERETLGAEFDESHADWNLLGDDPESPIDGDTLAKLPRELARYLALASWIDTVREFYGATEAPGFIANISGREGSVGRVPLGGAGWLRPPSAGGR